MTLDPYLDLQHGVLRNRLGITDPAELARAEAVLTATRIYELEQDPLPGRYDLEHLQAFHHAIFQDVYEWAGELRTVNLGRGALFCPPGDLVRVGRNISTRLARANHLRGLPRSEFVDGLTQLLAEINSLHPFRDGNGRSQRALLRQLSRDAGYPVNWAGLDREANNAASAAAHRAGDTSHLRQLIDQLVAAQGGNNPRPAPPQPRQPDR